MSTKQSQAAVEREVRRRTCEYQATIESLQRALADKTKEVDVYFDLLMDKSKQYARLVNDQQATVEKEVEREVERRIELWMPEENKKQLDKLRRQYDEIIKQKDEAIRLKDERIKDREEWAGLLSEWLRERDEEIKDLRVHLSAFDSFFREGERSTGTGEARVIPIH